jgi:hypothetical protein
MLLYKAAPTAVALYCNDVLLHVLLYCPAALYCLPHLVWPECCMPGCLHESCEVVLSIVKHHVDVTLVLGLLGDCRTGQKEDYRIQVWSCW